MDCDNIPTSPLVTELLATVYHYLHQSETFLVAGGVRVLATGE